MRIVSVRRNEHYAWCVYLDGEFLSDHATHEAARVAAQRVHLAERERAAHIGGAS